MSGGGSSKKSTPKKEEPAPAPAMTTQAAFMPGMDTMLAQQLGMGGYGDPSSLLAYMNSIQTPMKYPEYKPGTPLPTTTPTTTTPTTPSMGGSGSRGEYMNRLRATHPQFRGGRG